MKIKYILLLLQIVIFSCKDTRQIENQQKMEPEVVKADTIEVKAKQEKIEKEQQNPKTDLLEKRDYDKFTKGIYLTAYTIASKKFYTLLDSAEAAGMNALVFDLKNMNGHVFARIPQKGFLKSDNIKPIIDITKVVNAAHKRDMRAIARVVMFHDQLTAQRDSLMRPKNIKGGYWQESKRRKSSWLDSSNLEVQNTLLSIIEEIAKMGVDEIQMDYVRFPTQGKISDAVFAFQRENALAIQKDSTYVPRQKPDIIKQFVSQAKMICNKYNVTLTADVFAIVSWQRSADINFTGQDIKKMTQHLDALHPMIYSSHFNKDFGFREDLPNEPYFIVYKGSILSKKYASSECRVIPYIQSNSWKVNYGYDYIAGQIQAVIDSGADGYILWNASNRYYQTLRWIREFDNID